MANIQPKLTDGVDSPHLKHQRYIEQVPCVDKYFLSRCYNAADSDVRRRNNGRKRAQKDSRKSGVTYLMALRKLARRVCLDPNEPLGPQQIAEVIRTRAFLGPRFFELMGFYGVDIVPSPGQWTFSESASAEALARDLDLYLPDV